MMSTVVPYRKAENNVIEQRREVYKISVLATLKTMCTNIKQGTKIIFLV